MADSDGDFSDAKPAAASAGKLSTSVQSGLALNPATLGSSTECTGRFIRSKENDVQNFAGSEINHVIQSPTDWTGWSIILQVPFKVASSKLQLLCIKLIIPNVGRLHDAPFWWCIFRFCMGMPFSFLSIQEFVKLW